MAKVASKKPAAEKLIEVYIKIRDHIDARRKAVEEELTGHKEELALLESALKDQLTAAGADSFKTPAGTAFFNTKDYVSLESHENFISFVKREDAYHMLPRSVVKSAVKEYMTEHNGDLPPGVTYGVERVVQVRRPRS